MVCPRGATCICVCDGAGLADKESGCESSHALEADHFKDCAQELMVARAELLGAEERNQIGSSYGCFLSLVHSVRPVLAASDIGLDSLSIYLATPAAIPHRRNRCTWRAGAGLGAGNAACPAAERAIPAGVICRPLRIAGSAVVQHRAEARLSPVVCWNAVLKGRSTQKNT